MSPKLKPINSEITEKLNTLSYKERHDTFVLNRLKQQADKIIAKHPSNAYKLLGAVAALSKDIKELRYNHEMALRYSTKLSEDYYNYAVSLSKLGFKKESIVNSTLCYKHNFTDLVNLDFLIENYYLIGDINNAMKYLKSWERLKPTEKYKNAELIANISDAIEKSNIKQNVLMDFIEGILEIFQKNRIYIQNYGIEIIEDGNGNRILKYNYTIDMEYEQTLDIEDEIYENLSKYPLEIQKNIIIDLDTEDPRLEEFIIYLNNYEKENKACNKEVDPDKMDYIAKLIQVDY